eukprot:scaffold1128_cov348-Pavlova_lutheri.AAC.7
MATRDAVADRIAPMHERVVNPSPSSQPRGKGGSPSNRTRTRSGLFRVRPWVPPPPVSSWTAKGPHGQRSTYGP